ncbi:homoserine O-succinyltransferase [Elioraea sp.]|uniref:homoserine O-acetyltransferase/O-succinyltransferase family protein n=1 Tax=Elioraea sp. TaxID=2185103 RepID=UPI0025C44AC0|nr:homoserine O-succinyltransferase [Elioraea sp.]
MPILLQPGLPAAEMLRAEGVPVTETTVVPDAALRIGLVNLMPDRARAEQQWGRLLGAAPETVSLSLFSAARGASPAAYRPIEDAATGPLDGLIVTGAPVETLPFDEVRYWPALAALFDHAAASSIPTLSVCWAAMAALHHFHGVAKHTLPRKAFGLYAQAVQRPGDPLMQGIGPRFAVPVSRHATVLAADVAAGGAEVLAASAATGVSIAADAARGHTMLLDHLEYDGDTLLSEFLRDRAAARPAFPPAGLALGAAREPTWRPVAHLVLRNWLAQVARAKVLRQPADLLSWLLAPPSGRSGPTRLVLTLDDGVTTEAAEHLATHALAMPGVRDALLRGPGHAGLALRAAA